MQKYLFLAGQVLVLTGMMQLIDFTGAAQAYCCVSDSSLSAEICSLFSVKANQTLHVFVSFLSLWNPPSLFSEATSGLSSRLSANDHHAASTDCTGASQTQIPEQVTSR